MILRDMGHEPVPLVPATACRTSDCGPTTPSDSSCSDSERVQETLLSQKSDGPVNSGSEKDDDQVPNKEIVLRTVAKTDLLSQEEKETSADPCGDNDAKSSDLKDDLRLRSAQDEKETGQEASSDPGDLGGDTARRRSTRLRVPAIYLKHMLVSTLKRD